MPNEFLPTASPIWGIPMRFNISDFKPAYTNSPTLALTQVAIGATTRSPALDLKCRSVFLDVSLQDSTVTCSINVYSVISGVDTLVYNIPIVKFHNLSSLYVGNFELVDLQGLPFKVEVVSPVNGWVSVSVTPTR